MQYNSRKLQVFVSSTYQDLKDERQAAVESILQSGHIPAGMELFAAGDESQLATIKRWIDECDALLLLLGERYGSIEPKSGKSYTQLEYEYACDVGKRVFAIVLSDEWINSKFSQLGRKGTDDHRTLHANFKDHVLQRTSTFASDLKDIQFAVIKSLREIERDDSLGGWVRASLYSNSELLVSELRKTIEDLRSRPTVGLPTVTEIDTEVEKRYEELRVLQINELMFIEIQGKRTDYRFQATALTVMEELLEDFLGEYHDSGSKSEEIKATKFVFERSVAPLLEIWEMLSWRENESVNKIRTPKFTAKGVLLLNRIEISLREPSVSVPLSFVPV
jgi:hypothetical protein